MVYFDELTKAMTWLGEQPDTVFLGQQVAYPGNALFKALSGVPMTKRTEMPVAEDMQMGMAIGMSLAGKVPICIFPRMNFLMCAMNQLVNHLDKMADYSHGEFKPKVIVRVCVGSETPLDPGVQHKGDYPIHLDNVDVYRLFPASYLPERCVTSNAIVPIYQLAYNSPKSALIIEYADLYGEG